MAAGEGGAVGVSGLFVRTRRERAPRLRTRRRWAARGGEKRSWATRPRTHAPADPQAERPPTAVSSPAARDVVREEGGGRGGGGRGWLGGGRWGSGRLGEWLRGGRAARGPVGPRGGRAGGGRRAHSPQEGASAGLAPRGPRRAAGVRRASSRASRRAWFCHPHGNGNRRDSGGTTDQPAQAGEGEARPLPPTTSPSASLSRGRPAPTRPPGFLSPAHPALPVGPSPPASPRSWMREGRSLPVVMRALCWETGTDGGRGGLVHLFIFPSGKHGSLTWSCGWRVGDSPRSFAPRCAFQLGALGLWVMDAEDVP